MMKNIVSCKQLSNQSSKLLNTENLREIGKLVYLTDAYIYPSIFLSQEDAEIILAALLSENTDSMFCLDNCFVLEESGHIIGLTLWKKGPLRWSQNRLEESAQKLNRPLSPHFADVVDRYFQSYSTVPEEQISLLNVSVSPEMQGNGIGAKMMKQFLEQHEEEMELFVLEDNLQARMLYEKCGFKIHGRIQGFSPDKRDLPCLVMMREGIGGIT